jgi:DNA-binding response OmpR family regulator
MTEKRPILIVEDDEEIRDALAESFAATDEFETIGVSTCAEAEAAALSADTRIDVIVLDRRLPDGDGADLCLRLRRAQCHIPIIMLTGAGEVDDIVSGLEAGANDYVAKPFRMGILLARIRAQLRSADNSETAVLALGPYTFRPAEKLLVETATGRRVRLTRKEVALLKFLSRAEIPAARETLLNAVWGYNAGIDTHTLETHIYRLRQKIELEPGRARLLVTEAGGYKLDMTLAVAA